MGTKLSDNTLSSSIGQMSWERTVPESLVELTSGTADTYPLSQDVKKLEGEIQCSGEAQYVDDIEPMKSEVFAAFVYGKRANCDFAINNLNDVLVSRRKNSLLFENRTKQNQLSFQKEN